MSINWWQLVTLALGSGLTVKILDILHIEANWFRTRKNESQRIIDYHLDPVLKAADELSGKIRSLAENDFIEINISRNTTNNPFLHNKKLLSLVYLIAVFWCRLELLRRESVHAELARDRRGKTLKNFIQCLESRRVRILDRISQRAIGELMIYDFAGKVAPAPYITLAKWYETDKHTKIWIDDLIKTLKQGKYDRKIRQQILVYGVVVHAMIDTLDKDHHSTKDRPAIANKLSEKSRRELKFKVFKDYIPEAKNAGKYYKR